MKVAVGFLNSPEGTAALKAAVSEARLRDARLVVVHSLFGDGRDENQLPEYTRVLREVELTLESDGIDYEIRELVRGKSPSEDLLAFSDEEDVDLIVIGVRRRTAVGKLLLGSNAQEILLRANCPVLAVKADSGE